MVADEHPVVWLSKSPSTALYFHLSDLGTSSWSAHSLSDLPRVIIFITIQSYAPRDEGRLLDFNGTRSSQATACKINSIYSPSELHYRRQLLAQRASRISAASETGNRRAHQVYSSRAQWACSQAQMSRTFFIWPQTYGDVREGTLTGAKP